MVFKRFFPGVMALCLMLSSCAAVPTEVEEVVIEPLSTQEEESVVADTPTPTPFSLAIYSDYTIDPAWTEYRANLTLAPLLYEGLFQLSTTFTAQSLLCTSYITSGDGLVWTFTLREGVTFSDGTPLTGTLVAQSLSISASTGSRYEARLSSIIGFQGDDTTVTLTLSSPNASLPTLLDVPITLLQEEDPLHPLGTGSYIYSGDGTSLLPRDDYWQTSTTEREEIVLHTIHYTDDLVSAFDAGYVSLVDVDLMGTQAPYFSASYESWDYPTSTMIYLGFNQEDSACTSLQLRQIVAMAVDRATIVTQYFAQHAVAATLPLHPVSSQYDVLLAATGDYSTALLAAAVEELTPLDTPLQFITSNENSARYSTASYIVDTLNGAGIATELVSLSWDDYLVALEEGNFDIYLAETQLTADFDLSPILQTDGSLNYGGYTSATTDQLLSAVRSATSATLNTTTNQLYTHLLEQAPIVPICFKNGSVLTHWGQISQLNPTQSSAFYQMNSWIFTQQNEG